MTYAFPLRLPAAFAAPVQILRTCRALCDLGVEVTIVTGQSAASDEYLAVYDVQPHHLLTLFPVEWSRSLRPDRKQFAEAIDRTLIRVRSA